jgi:membrane-associated phospholipid phosphatase
MKARAFLLGLAAAALGAQEGPPPWTVPTEPGFFLRPEALDLEAALPAPPSAGSLEELADLETVRMVQAFRTPAQEAWARTVETDTVWKAGELLGPAFTAARLPRTARFFWELTVDVHGVSEHVKRRFDRRRPPAMDGRIRPCVSLPPNASYPSGHAFQAFVRAEVLADLFPERAVALRERAHRAAWARIQGGVHHPTDDLGGQRLAAAFVAALRRLPAYGQALARCREEIAQRREAVPIR